MQIKSISSRLLRSVMSIYMLLTLGIFVLELSFQYVQAKQNIKTDLLALQNTFQGNVRFALWNMNINELDVTFEGILKMPAVTRVIATAPDGSLVRDLASADPAKVRSMVEPQIISSRQSISYVDGDKTIPLGWLEIQSNTHIIANQLQAGVLLSLAAAMIKTLALVMLVRMFFRRILSRPLFNIARLAGQINPKERAAPTLPVKPGVPDELDVISSAINGLAAEVASTVGALDALNTGLEQQVAQRTELLRHANFDLVESMQQLERAQESLVESEKMAALGALVAGIAHEINTPVGLGLTGSSHFKYMIEQLEVKFRAGELQEADFERFLADGKELSRAIFVSLEKAAALVRSFKLVAVDQGHDEVRSFHPLHYLNDIILTHQQLLRKTGIQHQLNCAEALVIESYPGAWSQLLSNLIANSVIHAFDADTVAPMVTIGVEASAQELVLTYQDNGKGMSDDVAKKVFDPFFTTRRQDGGSGLGMHIVYNLVAQKLHGRIQLFTTPGKGARFVITMPNATRQTRLRPALVTDDVADG